VYWFTEHGRARLARRAQVAEKYLANLLEEHLYVDLGSSDGYRYLFQYVPTRGKSYVAVLIEGTDVIHSIFGKKYRLPPGVRSIQKRRVHQEARDRYLDAHRCDYLPPHQEQELVLA
tara:strand:- start:2141 stop:2491 length:351 start_codon:yes stop_codon:yes gene_type:complete